jgi:hypothetical protein
LHHAVMSSGGGHPLLWCGGGEQGHGGFGEVAAVAGLPLVVGFDEHGAGQAQQRVGVGEHADDVGAAFDFLVQPLERVGGPDLLLERVLYGL